MEDYIFFSRPKGNLGKCNCLKNDNTASRRRQSQWYFH